MVGNPSTVPNRELYQLRLPTFEGPLDVLLRLIEREQLSISEVSLLMVLDQFMAYLQSLESPSPQVIAEFATVACRLSLLKSRALLPKPNRVVEETDEGDLVRQLEEYRAVKLAAAHLEGRMHLGGGAFARGEAVAVPLPESPRLAAQAPTALSKAVARWLTRLPQRPVSINPVRVVTLREMMSRIFQAVSGVRAVNFERVRAECHRRQDVAVAFLALLTLLRRQLVVASQDELFGSITISRAGTARLVESETDVFDRGVADGSARLLV
jgi:segregation and condensation protein A